MNLPADIGVKRRSLTVEAYHRMGEAGIFAPGERVELIEGEIVEMAPIGSRHSGLVNRINHLLVQSVGKRAVVSVQNPVRLSRLSEPQPDFALLKPRADDYQAATPLPEDVLLLVEIAESSLRYDRELKAPLYAAHAIPELWVIDVAEKILWIYREPREGAYARVEKTQRPGSLRLAAAPDIEVDLGALFS
ncbi:MAG: Uma2 family endonuclease [Burkholderiales bacterium]|nr:Uma2 family endonuclease [Burkholderiales bacterium]